MAGDDVYAGVQTAPIFDNDDPFASMNATLKGILEALTARDQDSTQWDLSRTGSTILSQHIRFRCELLVFSASAAAVVTLTVGTATWTFAVGGADTKVIPFEYVIERGVDVSLTSSAGTVSGYLIGTRE